MNKTKGVLILLILSLFLIEESIRLQLPNMLFGNGDLESMEVGVRMSPGNADLNFRLARTYHNLMLDDQDNSETLFLKSINQNPLIASSWLELSEIYVENGENDKALIALIRAKEIAPLSIARLWQGAILALRLEQNDMAFDNLKTVAIANPELRYAVYDTSWSVSGDPEFILNELITDELLLSYLNYLITVKKADESLAVWSKLENSVNVKPDRQFMNYMNFLIDNKKSRQAYAIWSTIVGEREGKSLIWNGSFENQPLNGGFDWRIVSEERDGVNIKMDSNKSAYGDNSMRVEFDGKNNVEFYHLFQIVPVKPHREYLLSAKIHTDDITTNSGIRIETHCYPDYKAMSVYTKDLTGTNNWTELDLKVDVPEGCDDVLVRMRRFRSKDFDKYISGRAWIDDVKLVELGNI